MGFHKESEILDMMNKLKISREEALEVLTYDDDVTSNKATQYDLTPEQKAVVQELMRKTEHRKYGERNNQRKPNELKEAIVAALADFLENECEFMLNGEVTYCGEVEITNKNRMIHFKSNEKEFDLQLIEKRAKK